MRVRERKRGKGARLEFAAAACVLHLCRRRWKRERERTEESIKVHFFYMTCLVSFPWELSPVANERQTRQVQREMDQSIHRPICTRHTFSSTFLSLFYSSLSSLFRSPCPLPLLLLSVLAMSFSFLFPLILLAPCLSLSFSLTFALLNS